jgi:hypothetical protein
MNLTTLPKLTSCGIELDVSDEAFGELRRSDDIARDADALREHMRTDGYLYLPGLLDVDQVNASRQYVVEQLAAMGLIDESRPRLEAVSKPGGSTFMPKPLTEGNRALHELLYDGAMIELFERVFGASVRHFDYTWFRSVPGGEKGVFPHCDAVYMNRGTPNLLTAWTPIGDVSLDMGGLMILENSHRCADKLRNYLRRDVDNYCTNLPDAREIESGSKTWQDWDGRLSSNPISLRKKLGGRWLTAEFKIGDVLIFSMGTVHCSLDNHSNRYRLSSDSRYQPAGEPVDERWIGELPIAHGPAGKRGRIC